MPHEIVDGLTTIDPIVGWMELAARSGASDFHAVTGELPVLRVDGTLTAVGEQPLTEAACRTFARSLLNERAWQELERAGEADAAYEQNSGVRFRVHVYRQRGNISIAARVIPAVVPQFSTLGLPQMVLEFATRVQGLVLLTGPTGSGKSTTMAALVDSINHLTARHIVTLEDPIEFVYHSDRALIEQREVGVDTVSFSAGLRSALRQDPDVILVGEMRDHETIATAMTAAETGHLVLATLHTPDAPQTIDRIIDVFEPRQQPQIRSQLATVLVGVVAQRLLPSARGKGRVAACEVLVNTPAVANLIRTDKVHQISTVMQTSRQLGMQTMDMHLRELIDSGLVGVGTTLDTTNK